MKEEEVGGWENFFGPGFYRRGLCPKEALQDAAMETRVRRLFTAAS